MKNNVILIGFMGVGKGSVARDLATLLDTFAIDCDDMIESFKNKKIGEIFKDYGEDEFRNLERKLAKFLKDNVNNAVISTGGGFYKIKDLNKIGVVVYLQSSFDAIINRLKSAPNSDKKFAKRPLLSDLEVARKLHKQREKEYSQKADLVINVENKTIEKVTKEIIKGLKKEKK